MKGLCVGVITLGFVIISCCPDRGKQDSKINNSAFGIFPKTESGFIIADTIIYDVIIKNPNSDDKWTDECLKNLKKKQFIDQLFESVYNESNIAYDLSSNKIILPAELKSLEKKQEIDRDKIGKIQFAESWLYNDSLMIMSKKVISVSLGIEVFDERGELLGYKHAFKIHFN